MKITIDLDDLGICEKGEALRNLVFDQSEDFHGIRIRRLGCYATFDVNDGFVEIDPMKYPAIYKVASPPNPEDNIKITAYESDEIVAMWWWDGDGDLTIWIKGEDFAYNNSDCKCDYSWREVELPL